MGRMIGKVAFMRGNPCGCCGEWPGKKRKEKQGSRRAQRRRERLTLKRDAYSY